MGDFVKIASKSDISEDTGKKVEVDGIEIALFRKGDEVFAIGSICPHQGGPLDEGGLHEDEVMCPWHGWQFNIKTGACGFNPSIKVETYKVKVEGNDVFVQA